jgi:hypothetical protein
MQHRVLSTILGILALALLPSLVHAKGSLAPGFIGTGYAHRLVKNAAAKLEGHGAKPSNFRVSINPGPGGPYLIAGAVNRITGRQFQGAIDLRKGPGALSGAARVNLDPADRPAARP